MSSNSFFVSEQVYILIPRHMASPVFMLLRHLVCPTWHVTGLLPHQSIMMLSALHNFWGCRHLLTSLGKYPICSTVLSYRAYIEGVSIAVPLFSVPVSLSPSAPSWPLSKEVWMLGITFQPGFLACQQHVQLLGPQPTHCWLHALDYYFEERPMKLRRISSSFSCSWLWFRAKDMKGTYRGLALVPSPYQYFSMLSLVDLLWLLLLYSSVCAPVSLVYVSSLTSFLSGCS